ncbi:hypothetical protein HDU93_003140, partial [Gonapodya sp. JEL0774]
MSQHSGKHNRDTSPPLEEQQPCSKAWGDDVSMSHSNLEELLAQVVSKTAKEALSSHGPTSSSFARNCPFIMDVEYDSDTDSDGEMDLLLA